MFAAAVQLLACAALYLWLEGRRLGPPVELREGTRRTAEEYLDAAGFLYRRHCVPGEVAAAYAASVARTLSRRLGLAGPAASESLTQLLASRSGQSPERIKSLFAGAAEASGKRLDERQAAQLIRGLDELLESV
jgi:hypothetical protein